MKNKKKIVVVGSINMDLVIFSHRIPGIGETIMGRDFSVIPGGKGANQAVAASRLGADVHFIGCVGDDVFGHQLLDHLTLENIGLEFVNIEPNTSTGVALITVSEAGENTIVLSSGANASVTPEFVQKAEELIRSASIMLIQLEIPINTVEEAVKIAKKHNVPIILNPAPARELSEELLKHIDYLVPNESEGKLIAFHSLEKDKSIREVVRVLTEKGVRNPIITLGEDEVCYLDDKQYSHLPAHKVDVVDTTAAGDSFTAGLAVALSEGKSLRDSLYFAQKVASITVTRFGAQPSLPYRKEVDE